MSASVDMLTEDDVVDAVCAFLERMGYRIDQRLTTKQTGVDIIATCAGAPPTALHIEAKGATSARPGSARSGQPFDSAQVRVHVAEAAYAALKVLSLSAPGQGVRAAIALPANNLHRAQLEKVHGALRGLGVVVFWVHGDRRVEVDAAVPL